MNDWREFTLGEIASDISYGYTASAVERPVGPKFLRITDIRGGKINWNSVPYCEISDKDYNKNKVELGDIVIARTGATTGITETIKDEIDAVFASYLIRFRINRKLANPFFVGYVLKSNLWREYVSSILGGSAQPGANAKQFANFPMRIPSLRIQSDIAEILSSLDDKIIVNNEINEGLESLAQALFKQWFIDFEFPNKEGQPYRSSGGQMVETALGPIPKGWKVSALKEIACISKEAVKPYESPDKLFKHYSIPAYDESKLPSSDVGFSIKSSKFKVHPNSVLVSKLNPRFPRVWYIGDCDINAICSTEFQVILPTVSDYFEFCYCYCKSPKFSDGLIAKASGTSGSHQRVRPNDILETVFPIAPADVIKLFSETTKDLLQLSQINNDENLVLLNLRDTLLTKLISGELEVFESDK